MFWGEGVGGLLECQELLTDFGAILGKLLNGGGLRQVIVVLSVDLQAIHFLLLPPLKPGKPLPNFLVLRNRIHSTYRHTPCIINTYLAPYLHGTAALFYHK